MKIAYVNFCGSGGCGHGRGASRAAPVDVESGHGLATMNEANRAAAVSMTSSCMGSALEQKQRERERERHDFESIWHKLGRCFGGDLPRFG